MIIVLTKLKTEKYNMISGTYYRKNGGWKNAVGLEIDSGTGHYFHYHPNRDSHVHIWYMS